MAADDPHPDADRIARLTAELQRERERAAARQLRIRELEQTVSALTGVLADTRTDIARARASRAWRIGHAITRLGRRATFRPMLTEGALARAERRLERVDGGALPTAQPRRQIAPVRPAMPEAERVMGRRDLAETIRMQLGPAPDAIETPLVSIVVVTHDGIARMRRLVEGLVSATDYPALELVVIDNGSSDGTSDWLRSLDLPFELRLLRNEENLTFSEANNAGAAAATGELLLLLNNDIVPFEPGWLRELVALHAEQGGGAVGATLLHLEERWVDGPMVQHRGIRYRTEEHRPRAVNDGDGEPLLGPGFGQNEICTAVTAATLLIAAELFADLDGFHPGYRFGTEDVDLGLKLLAGGHPVRCSGRAILFHEESATQAALGRDFMHLNRAANQRLLLERWGPWLRRRHRGALLVGDPAWAGGRPHVAITVTSLDVSDGWGDWYTAHELGDALDAVGFRVTYVQRKGDAWYDLPGDLDYLISLMDPFDLRRVDPSVVTIAWVRNWTERWLQRPWFWRADVLLVSSAGSARLIEQATGRETVRFPLATNPDRFAPQPVDPALAADYVFTGNHWGEERAVQATIAPRDGERFRIFGRGWDAVPALARYSGGELPYGRLPEVYSAAKVVIDDTAGPTLPYGAVNCRVFDALGCGTLALTNQAEGVHELFDDEYPTWDSPQTMRAQLDALLRDDAHRRALAERYRGMVLERHTYAHRAARLREVLTDVEQRLSWCIKIGPPDWDVAEQWGDTHFARAIERELRRRGHRCVIQVLEEWESLPGLEWDVVLHVKGLSRSLPKPGQRNVLWCISHPEMLTPEECDGHDLVFVASEHYAAQLRERTETPVYALDQATDPAVFYPDPDPAVAHELVYVANSRNVLRPMMRDLLPTRHDLAIWGDNWDGLIDTALVRGTYMPNEELRRVYSSAGIVLADHWDDMRAHGFVSNRIYDALACGAVVVCDAVPGLERFGDAVVAYEDRADLRATIDALLADPADRARRGAAGMALVRASHTFAARVDVLAAAVQRLGAPVAAA